MDNETRNLDLDERKELAGVSRHGQHEMANLSQEASHFLCWLALVKGLEGCHGRSRLEQDQKKANCTK